MVTEVIGLTEPLVTCSENYNVIQLPDSYLRYVEYFHRNKEQYETAPLMFIVDLYELLYCSTLHSLSPTLLVVHQSTMVDASKPSRLVYRKS